ncbi:MAG TPA: EfeM/EfeO family lipoprotein [Solirubrobacterales bacterium]|nr:EfeM/EfeO family lipoprotein [Solirubrobacterales bacterium]
MMRRACLGACAALLAVALVAGCGGDHKQSTRVSAGNPPAQPLEDLVLLSGNIPRVRAADFKQPTAEYRRYVLRELGPIQREVAELHGAIAAGDLAAARRAWLAADERYESIGAAYGAFGDLDAGINGGPGGLQGGVDSPEFTGLHRIELALWGRSSTADAAPYVEGLARDVAALRRAVPTIEIEPLEYVLRSHEVLEGTLDLQLSGRESHWSGSALRALRGNLHGTEVVLGTLHGLIARRSPVLVQRSDASLAALADALHRIEGRGGSLRRWDQTPERVRTEIAGLTAAAAEQLAYIPEVIDPRPPLPRKSAIGTVAAE